MKPNHRRCVSCRAIAPKPNLWRVVRQHDTGTVQLDQGLGRSAYLCPTTSCLSMAQKKNRLSKALRVSVSETIYQQLWQRLQSSSSLETGSNRSMTQS
ncbi:YlxR family protein [Leptolyngbya iicbica]|uniref:YlxR family protein n=3 Tax=Cyanophyceae TaxID=3028117 RepID=A0A4Q7EH42_9CYAN|nr:YlxR family protein [Leptolyngbya sp. LK]RZM82427.1 YlxR family protein [Leptolyngbya sp. LK]